MAANTENWKLDDRLAEDTLVIEQSAAWWTLLMNDQRWPWIIVVPTVHDAFDTDDLSNDELGELMAHLSKVSKALKTMNVCTSTNVATLSNVVKQMHWHVVGRKEGDPNWPAPVWGFEKALPYGKDEAAYFITNFQKAFRDTFV